MCNSTCDIEKYPVKSKEIDNAWDLIRSKVFKKRDLIIQNHLLEVLLFKEFP